MLFHTVEPQRLILLVGCSGRLASLVIQELDAGYEDDAA